MEETVKTLAGRVPHAEGASTPSGRDERDEAQAIEELFRGCERRLGAFLVQMIGDRPLAEDGLQDTFHDTFRLRGSLATIDNPEAWLFGIARNRSLRFVSVAASSVRLSVWFGTPNQAKSTTSSYSSSVTYSNATSTPKIERC